MPPGERAPGRDRLVAEAGDAEAADRSAAAKLRKPVPEIILAVRQRRPDEIGMRLALALTQRLEMLALGAAILGPAIEADLMFREGDQFFAGFGKKLSSASR